MLISFVLTLVFTLSTLALALLLAVAAWRHRQTPFIGSSDFKTDAAGAPQTESGRRLETDAAGPRATNSWLVGMRSGLLVLIAGLLGMHLYWVYSAASDPKSSFAQAEKLDARNIRLAESGLKGWVLDRSGSLENALARYRSDGGIITRDYPLGPAAAHLTGFSDYVFGSGGMEFAFRKWLTSPVSTMNQLTSPVPVGKDLTVSIDSRLQRDSFNLLQSSGKPAAAVVLLLPNNEVLALASAPSFDPLSMRDEETWRRMSDQAETAPEISPLVDRALGTLVTGGRAFYYRPGSTFKTFTAAVAIEDGVTGEKFTCRSGGFVPPGSNRPIRDFEGEVHGTIDFRDAFRLSCNQYFAQLGLKLGKERLSQYARRLDLAFDPNDTRLRAMDLWQAPEADASDFNFIFAPPISRMNLSRTADPYDVALESFGQGYDDMTVFKMALLAAAVAHPQGSLVSPTFTPGAAPRVIGQFISPASAATLREMMKEVVQSGTAAGAFRGQSGRVSAAGKTGTADRDVQVYDSAGRKVIDFVDSAGRTHYKTERVTDGWFIGFAPASDPRIAFAVIVENGGQGARSAAPIAARLIQEAGDLGYLAPNPASTAGSAPNPTPASERRPRRGH